MTFVQNPGTGTPVFDYSSRDYSSLLQDLLLRQQVYLPEWTSTSNNDFGIVLLEEFAYAFDVLNYYIDRLSNEAFIQTATQPQSILNIATMLGYTPYLSVGSSVTIDVTVSSNMPGGSYPVTIAAGSQFSTLASQSQGPIVFTTQQQLQILGPLAATPSYTGAVAALQGVQYTQNVATSNGSINQAFSLSASPVSANSFTVEVDLGSGPQPWTFVGTLVNSGPFDQVFTNFIDANQNFYIVFGDGVNGYVPPLGSPITATYMTNSGSVGNVSANTIVTYVGPPAGSQPAIGITGVANPLAATGGAAAEAIASIQQNAPAALRTLSRGVTVSDITTLAQNISGFIWASVVEQTYQLVNLYMVPNGGGSLTSSQIQTVQNAIQPALMANTTLTVVNPTYISIDVTVNVTAFANFANATVQTNVINALIALLALQNTGFGFRVALGLVYEAVDIVSGVNYSFVTQLNREVLCTLTTALPSGPSFSVLSTTALPQAVAAGDVIVLTSGAHTQSLTASAPSVVGAFQIQVSTANANATYPVGSSVRDSTTLGDAVTLGNEVPIAGQITITVTGGTN